MQHGKEGSQEKQKTAGRALEQRQGRRAESCARRGLLHAGARGRPKQRPARKPARFRRPTRGFLVQRRGRWRQKRSPRRKTLNSFLSYGAGEDNPGNQRSVEGRQAKSCRTVLC